MVAHIFNPSTWKAEAGGLREFEANLGYIARPCLEQTNNQSNKHNPNVYSIFFHNRPNLKSTRVYSISKVMNKVWYTQTMKYYSFLNGGWGSYEDMEES
jgi:hypothetical protein